ncbi:MAG: hypothetical protein ACREMZ_05745 [Gemmatimonadales bacterium]
MSEGSPARIDRAALERIIQRAAELQSTEREIGDSLTSDELMALGRDVGIPGRYLQQALLEERTRLGTIGAAGLLERVAGPGEVVAQRVVGTDPQTVEQELLLWIERNELLCVQRQQAGRITWEPIGGIQAAIRRSTAALGTGKRPFMLSRAATVSATVIPLESGYSHVTLSADTRKVRGEYLGAGAAFATAGAAGTAVLLALGALLPLALLPLPVALGLGYSAVRRYGPAVARVHLGLERALDFLEQGTGKTPRQLPERSAGILGALADEVRKALRS